MIFLGLIFIASITVLAGIIYYISLIRDLKIKQYAFIALISGVSYLFTYGVYLLAIIPTGVSIPLFFNLIDNEYNYLFAYGFLLIPPATETARFISLKLVIGKELPTQIKSFGAIFTLISFLTISFSFMQWVLSIQIFNQLGLLELIIFLLFSFVMNASLSYFSFNALQSTKLIALAGFTLHFFQLSVYSTLANTELVDLFYPVIIVMSIIQILLVFLHYYTENSKLNAKKELSPENSS